MHPRNRHKSRYDLKKLCQAVPELNAFLITRPEQQKTIDFSNPQAVICLNKAILALDYGIKHWSIPDGFLCPPIPGRVDYIHYLADLLTHSNGNRVPTKPEQTQLLDIGCGASLIYPLLAHQVYKWRATGADIDPLSVANSNKVINDNNLSRAISVQLQSDESKCFANIIGDNDRFDVTLCNPPFHDSLATALKANQAKRQNLAKNSNRANHNKQSMPDLVSSKLNFGGQKAELFCDGGELKFVRRMIMESKYYAKQVLWFTCLVSNKEHLRPLKLALKKAKVVDTRTVTMRQGQKTSRFIAWSFHNKQQQLDWCRHYLN
ncbi:23S rRNA (adenine(1618)-N(6))-methyltransferase RlmF [Thalassotalea maritima]|uniref:23S rRNA (adenine(1618)-N(6))-methyltransferase RlmF n=1 Tax=Thalassotalea maritima TaxID=3242416 RepID=UPI003528EC34